MSLREYITSILQHTDIHCFFKLTSGHQFGDNKQMVFSVEDPMKFHQIPMLEFPMHNICIYTYTSAQAIHRQC